MKLVSKLFLLIAASLLFSEAFATGNHNPPPKPAPDPTSINASLAVAGALSHSSSKSSSASHSSSKSSSNATGGKSIATGGLATSNAAGGAGGSGGESNVNVDVSPIVTSTSEGGEGGESSSDNHLTIEGDEATHMRRIPVATALAGGTNTTANCRYSAGVGGQTSIFGLSIGGGRKDLDCERFELAQYLYANGNRKAGNTIMCKIGTMRDAFGDEETCLEVLGYQISATSVTVTPADPRLEKKAAFERGVGK